MPLLILTAQLEGDLVPAISFNNGPDRALLDGEVQGHFPAEFRLDITEPPPESAIFELPPEPDAPLKGGVAIGSIVVVPRDHPRLIPRLTTRAISSSCDDAGICTNEEESCAADGRCRQRTVACHDEECPLITASGDPSIRDEFEDGSASIACFGESCLGFAQHCLANECYREFRACDVKRASETTKIVTGGEYRVCEVLAESGDTSLAPSSRCAQPPCSAHSSEHRSAASRA